MYINSNIQSERSRTGLYVTTGIKGKAAFVAQRVRTNDAGVITDQDGENENRLKRLCLASSAFESIASHYRSSVIDISIRSTSYFFTRDHVAFIDYHVITRKPQKHRRIVSFANC